MERASQWMRSAVGLAALAGDDAPAQEIVRRLCGYCVDLMRLPAVGVLLGATSDGVRGASVWEGTDGLLRLVAETDEEGPAHFCLRTGSELVDCDLRRDADRWPVFAERALSAGVDRTTVLPLRRGDEPSVGVLQLLSRGDGLPKADRELAQELGDLCAQLLSHVRALDQSRRTSEQLGLALDSRIVIEQAKGILAERWDIHPDEAFGALRGHARAERRRLNEVARDVVENELDPERPR
ncbi:ANTAR domain-containing protein [Streptomyces sp. NPDC050504]|uniref:GAF and ANTAR domain-containing protein n=1 Tax=Streptomyces sp. NPDC050504 TaxID=3365618 RepID=UPI0037B91608